MKRALAVAMLIAGTAHADRRTAEQLFKEAEVDRDPAKFDACGRAYIDLYSADPAAADGDEALFDAALCFTGARSIGAAEQALQQLVTTHPNSKLAAKAILRIGQIDEVTGRLDQAAKRYEEYAKKYAGEKDASDAIQNAFTYRVILGDDAAAIEDAKYAVRTFGAKRPAEAAAMMFRLVPIYERSGDAIAHVDDLIKTYGKSLDDTQRVVAMAKLAELEWDRTCKGRALCVTELPHDKVPRCGDGVRLRVDKRSDTKVAEARLAAAVRAFEERQPKDAVARRAYAMAKLRIADRALEAYLAVAFPAGLDFSEKSKAKSLERFNHFVGDKQRLGQVAQQQYEAVLALHDPDAAIAAAARIGQVSEGFASTLRTAEIPAGIRTGEFAKDKTAAYCDKMLEVAEPLAARALEAFSVCRQKSFDVGVDGTWTALCRRESSLLDPKLVVDEPQLGALIPIHPPPGYVPAPRATKQDPPAYSAALEAAEKTACPKLAAPTTDSGRYLAAVVAQRCGDTDEARRGWAALPGAAALASLGSLRWNTGDGPGALDAWTRAGKLDGKLAVPHYGLALARFADPSREKEVELDLLNASIADPDSTDARVLLALLELRRNRPMMAELHLSRIEKPSAPVRVVRALLEAHEHRLGNARALLEAADKDHWPQASYDLALLALARHDYESAAERLRGVKQGYDALVATGVASAGLGTAADAISSYTAGIQLDGARPEAHFDLGLALAAQAKFHDAAEQFRLAKADALAARYGKLP